MIEDDINSNRCRFCKSSFSIDILKKIKDDRNDVYCENCGDLIKRIQNNYNFNPTEIIEKTANTNTKDTPTKPQNDLKSNPDALHYPIGRIFYDKEFPLIFKSNFIIVFSRLTYFHALHLESEGQIELGGLEVPENIINNLFMSIRHIQDKRIRSEFLNNLHEISKEEFERNLKQLQTKIQSNRQYREDFIVYSRWLINRVLTIVSEKKPNDQLTKFERTILTDIKNIQENLSPFKRFKKDQIHKETVKKTDHNFSTQEKWENKLKNQIDKNLQILELPDIIKQNSLELYDEILEYITHKNNKDSFSMFYDSLGGRKDPKYTAAVLIYIILRKNKNKITQKKISDQLEIHRRIITDVLSVLRNYLMKMPEHLYIYDITRSEGISINNFHILFQGLVNSLRKVNIDLSEEDLKEIKILLNIWNLDVNKFQVKGIKYISSTIIYIYIMFHKDHKIYQKEFVNIINELTPLSLNYSKFSMSFSEIFNPYFTLNINNYKQKMFDYLMEYINEVEATREILESSIKLFEYAIKKRLKKPFTPSNLKTPITKLKIIYIDKKDQVHYIFPQEMALILLYYNFKRYEGFDFLASKSKFIEYFGELKSVKKAKIKFKTLIEANRVYPLIKDNLGRLKRQWFTKESFIRELTDTLKNNYHADTDLMLKLYLLSIKSIPDLSPQNFIQLLDIYGGKLGPYYRDLVIYQKSLIHPKVFKKISVYIETYLVGVEKDNAQEILSVFIKKRQEEWNNYDNKYKFQRNEPNISHIQNSDLLKLLKNYLTLISLGQFPLGLFLDETTDRASNLKLIAKKPHQIKTQDILNFFHRDKKLIYKFPNNMGATELLKLVKKLYNHPNFLTTKAHRLLQDYTVNLNYGRIGMINPIATEIPVWKKYSKINEFITGHIDFLFVLDDYLIIADLKPRGKQEILKSIPQLLAYAIMLNERLRELNDDKTLSFKILCLGFSKDEAWVFNLDDVKKEILYFMKKECVKSPVISSTEKLIAI